tara:strand:+ start:963 stop:1277 length:315 start_codon:yes stop_codon:yes gene_type:complete
LYRFHCGNSVSGRYRKSSPNPAISTEGPLCQTIGDDSEGSFDFVISPAKSGVENSIAAGAGVVTVQAITVNQVTSTTIFSFTSFALVVCHVDRISGYYRKSMVI